MTQLVLFNYSELSPEVAGEVKAATERIKLRMKRTAEDIVAIGQDLNEVKERIPHGQFLPWLQAEFEMGQRTAYNFMAVAEQFGDKLAKFANLKPSAIFELAAPSTPEPVRQEVIARSEAGEEITLKEIKELKRQLIEKDQENGKLKSDVETLDNAAREVDAERTKLFQKVQLADSQSKALDGEIKDLLKQIHQLQMQKPEVIKETVEVEKIPEGFTSAQDAIKSMQRDLKQLEEQKNRTIGEIGRLKREADEYSNREEQVKVKQQKLFAFKHRILKALAESQEAQLMLQTDAMSEAIRNEIHVIAKTLDELAEMAWSVVNTHQAATIDIPYLIEAEKVA